MQEIKSGADIVDCKGRHVGTVDQVYEAGYVKMTRRDSPDGRHHFFRVNAIDHLDGDTVVLEMEEAEFKSDLLDALPQSDYSINATMH